MFSILSFAVIDGVNLAFSSTTILHLISTESSVRITICYFLGGIGTLVGAYFGGKLCDLYTLKKTGYMVLFTFVCGCMLCVIADLSQSYIFACLAYLNWGFQFTFFESYLLVCCSRFYDGSKESFAIVKQIHCLSFIVYEINSLLT